MKAQRWMLATVVLAALSTTAAAQEVSPTQTGASPHLWGFSAGLGVGSRDIGALVTISAGGAGGEVIARVAETSDFTIFSPPRVADDYAILFGRRRGSDRKWVRAAVGAGLVDTSWPGAVKECALFFCSHEIEHSRSIGLALQLDAVWAPARAVGLGLAAFGDLNRDMPFAGLTVNLHLGRLR